MQPLKMSPIIHKTKVVVAKTLSVSNDCTLKMNVLW